MKLTISQQSIEDFLALDLLSDYSAETELLENTYFDTPSGQLTAIGAALRVRKTPKGYLQTLKTRGQNSGGLHQRDEWEYPIATNALEMALFPEQVLPARLQAEPLQPLFSTNFKRTSWQISYNRSKIELVLDLGAVECAAGSDTISELELELKQGQLSDLFALALEISQKVAVMPSDISKAERGHRISTGFTDNSVELPDIVPQQSTESAFCALFGYEMERLQRSWQLFWSSQQWRHLQEFVVTLGNIHTEIEWFQGMMPPAQVAYAHDQIHWVSAAVTPILSWWPACFALSQDADEEPQSVAISLQQSKAKKALKALQTLQSNPELGYRLLSLTAWLHGRLWRDGQLDEQVRFGDQPVTDGLDYSFDKALKELRSDCFSGSTSSALSQSPAVHRLLMLCQYFDRLYGEDLGNLRVPLQALEDNLSRLSAIDLVTRLTDWLNDLPFEQQASIHSWTRSQTVLLRDIKQLANKLISGRDALGEGVV
ncbi:inorganic triphosphatase [Reinekea sp.]|uniref:CYTH domain-containing protein n=1 Tax=Reinekea sp. TaxID=1970455 RepID=UPI002A8079C6|nr:CYTH domain-containing protein [Reinekea sp.]